MHKTRLLFSVSLLFVFHNAPCQNLFANPGFEDVNNCVEYRTDCAPEAWFNIPAVNYAVKGRFAKPRRMPTRSCSLAPLRPDGWVMRIGNRFDWDFANASTSRLNHSFTSRSASRGTSRRLRAGINRDMAATS